VSPEYVTIHDKREISEGAVFLEANLRKCFGTGKKLLVESQAKES
jgi:hypothetical protein